MFVIGAPPKAGGPGMPHRAIPMGPIAPEAKSCAIRREAI